MRENIKSAYEKILELNIQINSLLNDFPSDDFENYNEKLQELLTLKDDSIQELASLKESSEKEFNRIKESELKEIFEQICKFEKENLELINNKKNSLSEEINKTNQTAKALSAYKFNKSTEPRIFDEVD